MWLTDLLRFSALEIGGPGEAPRRWRLRDLGFDLAAEPAVAATIALAPGPFRRPVIRGWSSVRSIDLARRTIVLAGTSLPPSTAPVLPGAGVPGRRFVPAGADILDALVLDLVAVRAARVNDLRVAVEEGAGRSGPPRIALEAADVGPWGLVRRVSAGRLDRPPAPADLVPWADLDFFRGDAAAAERAGDRHERLADLTPGEIARLAVALPHPHVTELLGALPDPLAADVLEAMATDQGRRAILGLPVPRAGRLLDAMAPDNATRLLAALDADEALRRLDAMRPDRRNGAVELLRYPEGSVGAAMTNELVRIPETATIAEARELARRPLARADFAHFLYVVDADGRLAGVLPLRRLLTEEEGSPVEAVMERRLVTIGALRPLLEAAQLLLDSRLAALPVLADDGRLLGALTVDAALIAAAGAGWRPEPTGIFS